METDGNFKSKQLTIKCNLQKQKQNKIKTKLINVYITNTNIFIFWSV